MKKTQADPWHQPARLAVQPRREHIAAAQHQRPQLALQGRRGPEGSREVLRAGSLETANTKGKPCSTGAGTSTP